MMLLLSLLLYISCCEFSAFFNLLLPLLSTMLANLPPGLELAPGDDSTIVEVRGVVFPFFEEENEAIVR